MTTMKRRELEAKMPPEVLRRAREGGMRGKVDWYAGRRHVSDVKVRSDAEVKRMNLDKRAIAVEHRTRRRVQTSAAAQGAITRVRATIVGALREALAFARISRPRHS